MKSYLRLIPHATPGVLRTRRRSQRERCANDEEQGAGEAVLRARLQELEGEIEAAAGAGDFARANALMAEQKEAEGALSRRSGGGRDAKASWLARQEARPKCKAGAARSGISPAAEG